MSLPSVYLAGSMSGWRPEVAAQWGERAITINPFEDTPQGSIAEFTQGDLDQIRQSSILFGVLDYPKAYTGMALEFGFARGLEIPCIYVHLNGDRVDSMMAGVSAAVFTDLNKAAEFTERRFF